MLFLAVMFLCGITTMVVAVMVSAWAERAPTVAAREFAGAPGISVINVLGHRMVEDDDPAPEVSGRREKLVPRHVRAA